MPVRGTKVDQDVGVNGDWGNLNIRGKVRLLDKMLEIQHLKCRSLGIVPVSLHTFQGLMLVQSFVAANVGLREDQDCSQSAFGCLRQFSQHESNGTNHAMISIATLDALLTLHHVP